MANCGECGSASQYTRAAPVDAFPPNRFGLYDMEGNVKSWTEDCWHKNYDGAPMDGSAWIADGDCNIRMVRGGAGQPCRRTRFVEPQRAECRLPI